VNFLPHALESNGYISDTAENRAKDIMEAFANPDIDIIMTMIGGNHANQTLKYIDWNLIKDNPKPFVGFSDISVLHMALYTQSGLKSFYGPAFITEFSEYPKPMAYTMKYLDEVIIQKKKIIEILPSTEWTDEFIDW
jgi:muramoyltetrapeptide carboxypeptidase